MFDRCTIDGLKYIFHLYFENRKTLNSVKPILKVVTMLVMYVLCLKLNKSDFFLLPVMICYILL